MDTPQPAVELSLFQFEGMHEALMAVATDRMEGDRQTRRALRKLQSNRHRSRVATHEAYTRYMAEGGEEGGGVQGFLEWLIANWESIFKIIMQIVGLFGAAATPEAATYIAGDGVTIVGSGEWTPVPASSLFDFDSVSSGVARKLLELVEIAERHSMAASAALEAYIAKAWPQGEPAPPVEVQRALSRALAA